MVSPGLQPARLGGWQMKDLASNSRQGAFSAYGHRKISLIYALMALIKSCRFWCSNTGPKQQVEQEQDVDRINE